MIQFDVAGNVLIIDGEKLTGKKEFPPNTEADSHFQSKPHYVRLKGTYENSYRQCIYSYTYEGWYYVDNGKRENAVEFWY